MEAPLPLWASVSVFTYLCCDFFFPLFQVMIYLSSACLWPLKQLLCISKKSPIPSPSRVVDSSRVPTFSLLQAEQIQVPQLSLCYVCSDLITILVAVCWAHSSLSVYLVLGSSRWGTVIPDAVSWVQGAGVVFFLAVLLQSSVCSQAAFIALILYALKNNYW